MRPSVFFTIDAAILCLSLFVVCILAVIAGNFVRNKILYKDDQESRGGANALLGALFGLWAFILAFTFGNVATRFENVRATMVEEANIIRTVILRSETFPDSLRTIFREDLKGYLQARIDYYEHGEDLAKLEHAKNDAVTIGKKLWSQAVHVSFLPNLGLAGNNMLTSLSGMYDVGGRRDAMLMSGVPSPISFMLFFIAVVISFVGGFTSPVLKTKEWVVVTGFIFVACIIIYITLDMARPMRGFIKPDIGQEKIEQLKALF